MIGVSFDYRRPRSIVDAVDLLARLGEHATVLAGGQSLIPALKAGADVPGTIVDIGRIGELDGVRQVPGGLVIGALTRHQALHRSPLVARLAPLLSTVAGRVADPQVRHRGTIGGSLAFAHPAADLPVALMALGASVVLRGPGGQRTVPVARFCLGAHRTAATPFELLTEVHVPHPSPIAWSFQKFHRDALQWAVVSVAAVRHAGERRVTVALGNVADRPLLATAVADAVAAGAGAGTAAVFAVEGTDPPPDDRASARYRQHLAVVLTRRALAELGL